MLVVPLLAEPSQTVDVSLAGQSCRLNVYEKEPYGVFVDVYLNDALVIGGVSALNAKLIVRDTYLGFVGDLAFFDTQPDPIAGASDPSYTGLGGRFILAYLAPGELGAAS